MLYFFLERRAKVPLDWGDFENGPGPGSDIGRYCVLHQQGGIYADLDYEAFLWACEKSVAKLAHQIAGIGRGYYTVLGPPVVGRGEFSLTKIDYRKKGTLILASLLEDLVWLVAKSISHYCESMG